MRLLEKEHSGCAALLQDDKARGPGCTLHCCRACCCLFVLSIGATTADAGQPLRPACERPSHVSAGQGHLCMLLSMASAAEHPGVRSKWTWLGS